MINRRGLRTEPWWTPTSIRNSSLYSLPTLTLLTASLYMVHTALTNYSSIPSFLIDHQIRDRGTHQ
uniref:Uncharacterized protein n=1 Tax=Octopus bimaculoides TaxID=37653 RepID=A0A0L8FSE3_OCTBM